MNTILIDNGKSPPITYTPNSFSCLLQGAEIGPSVSDFERKHTTIARSRILSLFNRFRCTKQRDFASGKRIAIRR